MKLRACTGKTCNAQILMARTINGKEQPLDPEPSAEGNTILIKRTEEQPLALSYAKVAEEDREGMRAHGVAFYVPHHATCPDVKDFR